MKVQIINPNGEKKSEITTELFDGQKRQDIVQKVSELERLEEKQLYSPYLWAGMQTSASGSVKHNRHVWKTDRGKGMSRFPKKRMSDKGSNFVWMGAVAPDTRKGRRAHPPKIIPFEYKINKKEQILAFLSALAMTSDIQLIKKKYSTLSLVNVEHKLKLPIIFTKEILGLKSKEFFEKIKKVLGEEVFNIAIQVKEIRSGRGKMRNRRYKQNAGMILVIGNKEERKISGIEVKKVNELKVRDLWENGARLSAFTEEAIKELESKIFGGKK